MDLTASRALSGLLTSVSENENRQYIHELKKNRTTHSFFEAQKQVDLEQETG
jgi:hypothetical protein